MNKKFEIIVFSNFSGRLRDLPLDTAGKKRTLIRDILLPHEEPRQTDSCELNPS